MTMYFWQSSALHGCVNRPDAPLNPNYINCQLLSAPAKIPCIYAAKYATDMYVQSITIQNNHSNPFIMLYKSLLLIFE